MTSSDPRCRQFAVLKFSDQSPFSPFELKPFRCMDAMTTTLTTKERELMCHALGLQLGRGRKQRAYRNYFNCEPNHPIWCSLCERGLATSKKFNLNPDDAIFFVTDADCIALIGMTLKVAEQHKLSNDEVRAAYGLPAKAKKPTHE